MKLTEEEIAKVAHEANKAYCLAIGDNSQPSWEEAPQWQKDSAINGVRYHASKPDSRPENSHENWSKEKVEEGWVWGPEKNPEKKEHPCLVPYEQLPESQKAKDYIFMAIAKTLLSIQ